MRRTRIPAKSRWGGTGTSSIRSSPCRSLRGSRRSKQRWSAGVRTQLIASQWTTLTDLREHSVTMLGGYNNQWTMRVTEPLRFHFLPDPQLTIVDGMQPQVTWKRDQSVPYSSADDYALVARFRDATSRRMGRGAGRAGPQRYRGRGAVRHQPALPGSVAGADGNRVWKPEYQSGAEGERDRRPRPARHRFKLFTSGELFCHPPSFQSGRSLRLILAKTPSGHRAGLLCASCVFFQFRLNQERIGLPPASVPVVC